MKNKTNVQFTILTKPKGILTKRVYFDGSKNFQIDPTQCWFSNGTGQVHNCNFDEFPIVLRSLEKNECLTHGIFDNETYGDEDGIVRIVTNDIKTKFYENDNSIISRTLQYFHYPSSNSINMFDYDVKDGEEVLSVDEYIKVISSIMPGFERCAKVVSFSTSSCLYDKNDTLLTGNKPSFHMYLVIKDSADIDRFKNVLFKRCWLAGYGKIVTRNNKRLDERTIFDLKVFSPERYDFVAGADCENGIVQKLPDPLYYDGGVLDTSLLPDLSHMEEIKYAKIVKQARAPYEREYEVHKKERIANLVIEKKCSEKEATSIITDIDNNVLRNDFSLTLDDGTELSAKELLDNGEKYDGVTLYDPFEPEQGRTKAKYFWNGGFSSIIHTFLHGEDDYFFNSQLYYSGRAKPVPTDKEPTFGSLQDFQSIQGSRDTLEKELKNFFLRSLVNLLIVMDAGLGKTSSFMRALTEALKHTPDLFSIRVAYFVPDNNLSEELLLKYHDRKNGLVGKPCMIRGRGHNNDHLSPPCKQAELLLKSGMPTEEYNQKVSLITAHVCQSCRYRQQHCAYIQQFRDARSAHIVLFPQQYLFTMTKELASPDEDFSLLLDGDDDGEVSGLEDLMGNGRKQQKIMQKPLIETFTHIVIDEDTVGKHVLNNTIGNGIFLCDRMDSEVTKGIIDDLENGAEVKHVLGKWASRIEEEYKYHRTIKSESISISHIKDIDDTKKIRSLAAFRIAEQKRIFWRLMKDACENLDSPRLGYINNVWADGNALKVCEKKKINTLWTTGGKKILYLDASADPVVVQEAFPEIRFKVCRIKTHRHEAVTYKQVSDNLLTLNHLKENYVKAFKCLAAKFDDSLPAFITFKDIEDKILEHNDLKQLVSTHGHYNKIRGTDDYKKEENLLVVGRYQLNGDALKEKARMLYPRSKEPLNFEYKYQEFVYRMKNGQNQAVMQKDYLIGSDVWRLNNHLSRSETEQAIARIRPFDIDKNGPKTKTVYILTSQVLDITVDQLFPVTDIIPIEARETGNEIRDGILRLLDENGGILKWQPKEIAKKIGVDVVRLNNVRKTEWFSGSADWRLITVSYVKDGGNSRKRKIKEKWIVVRKKPDSGNNSIEQMMNKNGELIDFNIEDGWC